MSETPLAPSWDGSVVLDIGADVGALMLHTSSTMLGREIDIICDDSSRPRTHSAVRERLLSHAVSFVAVYPSLPQGSYRIEGTGQRVVIEGGRVSELVYDESVQR